MAIVVALTHISLLIISFSKWEREPRAYQCDNKITTKSDESPAAKQQSVGAATDLSALIDTIRAEGRANRAEEKREDDAKTFRELVTIVLIGATLFAVCWQVYEMVQVYDPIRAQADEAKRSADAAAKQAESAERAFIQAQRAWIGPRNATIVGDVVVGKPVEIVFAYENSGHEPGVDFRAYAEPIRMSGDDDAKVRGVIQKNLEACRASVAWEGGSVVFPSVGGFGSGYTYTVKTPDTFATDAIIKGDEVIIYQGCFAYRTFTQPKHTAFCFFYKQGLTKAPNLNICESGNEAN